MSAAPGERIRGIEAPLPPGERVRWQGAPDARSLAVHVFHVRKLAVYFGLLLGWRAALAADEPSPLAFFAVGAATLGAAFLAAAGIAVLLAVLTARTTVYALTDRRLVMRVGIVVPAVINVPLAGVASAALRPRRDGTGDVALALVGDDRLAWFLLWPHARPWRFDPAEPALRCIREPERVGALLREAVAGCTDRAVVAAAAPAREAAGSPALARSS